MKTVEPDYAWAGRVDCPKCREHMEAGFLILPLSGWMRWNNKLPGTYTKVPSTVEELNAMGNDVSGQHIIGMTMPEGEQLYWKGFICPSCKIVTMSFDAEFLNPDEVKRMNEFWENYFKKRGGEKPED